MQRKLMDRLDEWKGSERRKPLIVNGARQVGKTWILKEFGRLHFESVAYVSLDKDERARRFFEPDLDPRRIVSSLSLHLDMDIDPGRTLVVLDEIQSCPAAITSLKYFCEDAQEYHVAAAGSLLGISATHGTGFPVGKVNSVNLFPLSFTEFLGATGNGRYAELVEKGDHAMMDTFSDKLKELLRTYYIVGGMPEAVNAYIGTADVRDARRVQDRILADYMSDFAKHVPANLLARTMLAWDSVPRHLSKENKKFVFGQVRKGARAADFEESLRWLEQAGLIVKVPRVSKPGMPLKAYRDQKRLQGVHVGHRASGGNERAGPGCDGRRQQHFHGIQRGTSPSSTSASSSFRTAASCPFTGRPRTPAARLTSSCKLTRGVPHRGEG